MSELDVKYVLLHGKRYVLLYSSTVHLLPVHTVGIDYGDVAQRFEGQWSMFVVNKHPQGHHFFRCARKAMRKAA